VLDIDVVGDGGQVVPVTKDLHLYTWFLGTIGRDYGTAPTDQNRCNGTVQVPVQNGSARGVQVRLPEAFGPVTLWVEDCAGADASWAVGASPTLWFPYPTLADVQKPTDLNPQSVYDIFVGSPLDGKQLAIDVAPGGKLVVTGVFAQFYTVTDSGLPSWNSLEVYSFGRPPVRVGDVLRPQSLTGAISDFNGMTELNFPLQDIASRGEPLPTPTVVQIADFNYGTDNVKAAKLESLEAALVELHDGCVCPRDSSYDQFQQWTLGFKNAAGQYGCTSSRSIGVVTAGQVTGWDPPKEGHHLSVARGVLVNIAGKASRTSGNPFSFFILHPRDASDLVDAGDGCTTM
jgi:hypothetical protein